MRKLLLFFAMLCVSIGAWAMMPPENEPVTDRNSYLIEQAHQPLRHRYHNP